MTAAATLSLNSAGADLWDTVVVGAGPAGAMAARELGRRGQRVLLVDKKTFPRGKVCGACLSGHALSVLRGVGLGTLPIDLGGEAYDRFRLWSHGTSASVPLPAGNAVTRFALDDALIRAAVDENVAFLPGTQAALEAVDADARSVRLEQSGAATVARAKVVIAADGLGGALMASAPDVVYRTWKRSRIGAGAVLKNYPSLFQKGAIYMAVAREGYVGLVRVENNGLNVGAALDVGLVRREGSIAAAIRKILAQSGLPTISSIEEASWRGTTRLTRRPSVIGAPRLFVIGDAAGYAEPFTGEGMAWAMTSGVMVVPYVLQAASSWSPAIGQAWSAAYRRSIRNRQNACFRLANLLRHPWLVRGAVTALARFPALANPFVRRLNTVPKELFA